MRVHTGLVDGELFDTRKTRESELVAQWHMRHKCTRLARPARMLYDLADALGLLVDPALRVRIPLSDAVLEPQADLSLGRVYSIRPCEQSSTRRV